MKNQISKSNFNFSFAGYGHYKVTYQSPITGNKWSCTTNDMPLIDLTKNNDSPRIMDLTELKKLCKNG
jgi:hypothetical protein